MNVLLTKFDRLKRYQQQMIIYDLANPAKNIIGECHGWSDCYTNTDNNGNGNNNRPQQSQCSECEYLSWSFKCTINLSPISDQYVLDVPLLLEKYNEQLLPLITMAIIIQLSTATFKGKDKGEGKPKPKPKPRSKPKADS